MTTNTYTAGTKVRCTATFVDVDTGQPEDPDEVTLCIMLPDGSVVTGVSVVRDSLGHYHGDYLTAQVGLHQYEFKATGALPVVEIGSFIVDEAGFCP